MFAFTTSVPIGSVKPSLSTSFTHAPICARPVTNSATTMILRNTVKPKPIGIDTMFGGVGAILQTADTYMADTVRRQYKKMANPMGVYGVQCTEGSVKFAADRARIRSLNADFRMKQRSTSKKYFDMYQNRKEAIYASHECHHEESQFCDYPGVTATYNIAKAEAHGQCSRYATPETVEEAAMFRYMDIQQNNAANPTGVYSSACNEGAAKGQAEYVRVAALNAAYRVAQKPVGQLLQEKYNQRKQGYAFAHGCNYEEGLINLYPAIGAAFRSRTYGF